MYIGVGIGLWKGKCAFEPFQFLKNLPPCRVLPCFMRRTWTTQCMENSKARRCCLGIKLELTLLINVINKFTRCYTYPEFVEMDFPQFAETFQSRCISMDNWIAMAKKQPKRERRVFFFFLPISHRRCVLVCKLLS